MRILDSAKRSALCLGAVASLLGAACGVALAQSSATRTLAPGSLVSAGGSNASATRALVGGMSAGIGQARGSSATRDVVSGIVGTTYSSQVTTTVATAANAYSGIGIPMTPLNGAVTSVFDELGAYDNTKWRLGHWSPADSAYQEPGGAGSLNLTTVGAGAGYWLITKAAANVASTGLPAPVGSPTRAAWNQIANPFLFPVAANQILVTNGVLTYTLTDAGNTLTDNVVKGWTAGSYSDVTVLNGRTSYWVHTKQGTSSVVMIVPFVASASGSPEPARSKPAGSEWAVALLASQGGGSCEPVWLGATTLAVGPQGPLNLTAAPAPPGGGFLSLHVDRPEWGATYVREFQPQAERMEWNLVAEGGVTPGELSLSLEGFDVPEGTRFWLTDAAAGTTREIVAGGVVTLAARSASRSLRLVATGPGVATPGITPLADAMRRTYPNPFASFAGLTFSLARTGDLRVQIFDVMGRQVRLLEKLAQGPGEHVLVWDGRDESGQAVASGIYLARYRAGTASGTSRLVRVE
jgi:hypothetical protein